MTNSAIAHLVDTIRQRKLLQPRRLAKLTGSLQARFSDPNALLQDLIRRGWLTPQQASQLVNVPVGVPIPQPGVPVGLPVVPPYQEEKRRRRYRWIQWNLVGLTILVAGGGFLWHVVNQDLKRQNQPTPDQHLVDRRGEAEEPFQRLQQRFADPYAPSDEVYRSLLEFRNRYPEVPQAVQVAAMIATLPGPLDSLERARIPAEELHLGQPKNLVAVFGERRWRHWAAAKQVVISPDGTLVASAGDDGKLILWSRQSGAVQGAVDLVDARDLHFTLDGQQLAATDGAGQRLLWKLKNNEHNLLPGPIAKPTASAISWDGQVAASAADDASIKLWDTGTGAVKANLTGHRAPVRTLAFAANQQWLLSGGDDATARLWNLAGQELITFQSTAAVRAVAISPDSRRLAMAGDDREVRVFDLTDPSKPKELAKMASHEGPITALAFSGDGQFLASASADLSIKFWDISRQGAFLNLRLGKVHDLAFRGKMLATAVDDGVVRLWNLIPETMPKGNDPIISFPIGKGQENFLAGHAGPASAVAFLDISNANQMTLASAGWDRTIKLWNLGTGRERSSLNGHETAITALAYSSPANRLVSGGSDGIVKLWSADVFTEVQTFGLQLPIQTLAFSSDGNVFAAATASHDAKAPGAVRLVDTWKHAEAIAAMTSSQGVNAAAFTPPGDLICFASHDGTVRLRNRFSGEERGSLKNDAPISALAVSPQGKLLVTFDQNGQLKFWDLERRQQRNQAIADIGTVTGLGFSPDGSRLATSHHEGRVVLWDPEGGKQLEEFSFPGSVRAVAFALDSRHLATANANGTIYVLRLAGPPPRQK